jgi:hypothetical protein
MCPNAEVFINVLLHTDEPTTRDSCVSGTKQNVAIIVAEKGYCGRQGETTAVTFL